MRFPQGFPVPLYNAILAYFILRRMGEVAVELWFHHPDQVFAQAFIASTTRVDGRGAGPVYENTKRTLAQMIRDGDIDTPARLAGMGVAVLMTNGFHHTCLARNRDNPLGRREGAEGMAKTSTCPSSHRPPTQRCTP